MDGYIIPLILKNGLLTVDIRTPTNHELKSCETVILISEDQWDPTNIYDDDITAGDYFDLCERALNEEEQRYINVTWSDAKPQDIKKATPYLLNAAEETVKKTLETTTQLGKLSSRIPLRPHYKTRNPILSKTQLMEPWAINTWFCKVTSYEGYNCCQLFVGQKSRRTYLYGMISEHSGPDALLDFFRNIGVPLSIQRDNSKMQACNAWNDIMRRYNSADKFTEPYNPQQNPAERVIGVIKNAMKRTMMDTGCDPQAWYRLACHVSNIANHTAQASLNWRAPIESSSGETPDISELIYFQFWERIYYYDPPSEEEKLGRWLGRATNYGNTMCYWILTSDTEQLIVRGTMRSAEYTLRPNLALASGELGEPQKALNQETIQDLPNKLSKNSDK